MAFLQTSARDDINVSAVFEQLTDEVVKGIPHVFTAEGDKISKPPVPLEQQSKKEKPCCN